MMGQSALRQHALVVEPSRRLREIVGILLEETGYKVREADSLDGVVHLLETGSNVSLLFVDLPPRQLRELALYVSRNCPGVRLMVPYSDEAEAEELPETALRLKEPWNALDVLIQAELARRSLLH